MLNQSLKKCLGYSPEDFADDLVYTRFPFQVFANRNLNFVIENGKFHSNQCLLNCYSYVNNNESETINLECLNLKYNSSLNNIIQNSIDSHKNTKNELLNFNQLNEKYHKYYEKYNSSKLNSLHKDFQILNYRHKITLYQQFVILLSTNDVPRIKSLLVSCARQHSSIGAIINKVNLDIKNEYNAKKWTQDEIDLAELVLRIGGPSLLYTFSQQNRLPSASYIYKITKSNVEILFSYDQTITSIIRKNISHFFNAVNLGFFSIKMDEIALVQRLRWSSITNEIQGLCYNHKYYLNSFAFTHYLTIEEIKKCLGLQCIHVANEALVITLCRISSEDIVPRPILVFPLCSHTFPEIKEAICQTISIFNEFNPDSHIINIATDGDHYRRKLINDMRQLSNKSIFYRMPLFSPDFVLGKFGLNFDIKHLIKRIRSLLISDSRSIQLINRPLNKSHIMTMLPNLTYLLDPKDKQN